MLALFEDHPVIFIIGLTAAIFILRLIGLSRNAITAVGIVVVLIAAVYIARTQG
jgi:hypothetical protein